MERWREGEGGKRREIGRGGGIKEELRRKRGGCEERGTRGGWRGCYVQVQSCFMSTETVSAIRDGKPRTATSTFTQLLSSGGMSSSVLLYLHRDRTDYH